MRMIANSLFEAMLSGLLQKSCQSTPQNLIEKHHDLSKTKEILLCWLPSHVGIKGNEAANVKAKASLDLEISNFELPCTDFIPFINRFILSKWQLSWDRATFNKLHKIKPVIGKNTIYRSLM